MHIADLVPDVLYAECEDGDSDDSDCEEVILRPHDEVIDNEEKQE